MGEKLNFYQEKILQSIEQNSAKILILFFVVLVLDFLGQFPYLNLIFGNSSIFISILLLVIIFLFHWKLEDTLILVFFLFLLDIILALLGNSIQLVEQIGNGIYGLMWIAFFQFLMHKRFQ